jgi:integrase
MLEQFSRNNVQIDSSTKKKVARSWRPFMARIGPDTLAESVTRADLVKYQGHLVACSYATASVNSYMAAVSQVFGWFVYLEALTQNPCEGLKHVPEDEREVTYFKPEEFDRLLEAIARLRWADPTAPLRLPGILWACWHGLRIGEALNLRWLDIDLDRGVLKVQYRVDKPDGWWCWGTKTHRGREVAVSQDLDDLLHRLKVACPWIYPLLPERRYRTLQRQIGRLSDDVRKMPYNNLYRQLNRIKEAVGVSDGAFHKLRRTAATELSERLQPVDLQKLLGHRSFATTQRYIGDREAIETARTAMNARRNAQGILTND